MLISNNVTLVSSHGEYNHKFSVVAMLRKTVLGKRERAHLAVQLTQFLISYYVSFTWPLTVTFDALFCDVTFTWPLTVTFDALFCDVSFMWPLTVTFNALFSPPPPATRKRI